MDERPIVLIGMMGAGKTAVGRVLARRLRRPFLDADDELVARAGSSVAEIFAREGEEGFRRHEAEVLADLLQRRPPVVVAAGGGVVVLAGNRRLLHDTATVVWLRAPVEELAGRVGTGRGRPLLADDPVGALARLAEERAPWYAETAHLVLDTARRQPGDLAGELARRLPEVASAGGRS